MLPLAETSAVPLLIEHGMWPFAVIFLVLFFHKKIGSLFDRFRSVDIPGMKLKIHAEQAQQKAAEEAPAPVSTAPNDTRLQPDSPFIETVELEMSKGLVGKPVESRINILTNHAAYFAVACAFERTYRVIFQSQLAFARYVNANGRVSRKVAEQYQAGWAKDVVALKEISFDAWIGFLINRNILVLNGDTYEMTPQGREFLLWCVREGLKDDRPL